MTRRTPPPLTVAPDAWPAIAAMLRASGETWPAAAAAVDLAWFAGELEAHRRPEGLARTPGRDFLAVRWNMKPHQVREILDLHRPAASPPPAHHQPTTSPGTVEPLEHVNTRQPDTSPAPAGHQPGADSAPERLAETSAPTVEPGVTTDPRQLAASSDPSSSGRSPPTPPLLFPVDHTDLSTETRGETEGPRRRRAAKPPTPPEPWTPTPPEGDPPVDALGAEARAFLRVYARWHRDPKAPARWRTPTPDALAWFLEDILGDRQLVAGLELVGVLTRWGNWLEGKAEAHGKPGRKGATFPTNWKNALTNWITNARTYSTGGPNARNQRGAWNGARQPANAAPPAAPDIPPDF